jgi:hypothetical protein
MLHSPTFVKLRLFIPRHEFTSKLGIYSRECRSERSPLVFTFNIVLYQTRKAAAA